MSDLVGNPEDRFSRVAAQMIMMGKSIDYIWKNLFSFPDSCPPGFTSVTGYHPCMPCQQDTFWSNSTTCTVCNGTSFWEGAPDESHCRGNSILISHCRNFCMTLISELSHSIENQQYAYAKIKPQISCAVTALMISSFVLAS